MIKNNKGLISIEVVIFALIYIIILSFFVDISMLVWKYNSVSRVTTYVARVVSRQSGISNYVPYGFPGGSSNYITANNLYYQVLDIMKNAGFKSDEWNIYINGIKLSPGTYLEFRNPETKILVELRANYKWALTKNFLPFYYTKTISSKRIVYPAFRFRDGDIQFIK